MRTRALVAALCLFACLSFSASPVDAQQNGSSSQSNNEVTAEGRVTSVSRTTLVIRTDENQYQLFTYDSGAVRPRTLAPGARVRVTAGSADENGTRVATNVEVISAAGGSASNTTDKGAQAAPVPQQVRTAETEIRRESRRWRLGGRAGIGFDPELFTFGVQSQMGPIFHPRVLFRPNAEFAFGEVTDLIALNLEGIYRFSTPYRGGVWTPYVGAGPALIFIHQNFQQGRDIDFGNFDYETGFNVLAGMQARSGMFGELKTSLWSGPAPKLRLIIGYTF